MSRERKTFSGPKKLAIVRQYLDIAVARGVAPNLVYHSGK